MSKSNEAAKAEPVKIAVPCIKCFGESVSVDLDGLEQFRCVGCQEEFTRDDVQQVIDAAKPWARMLKWLDSYPTEDAE